MLLAPSGPLDELSQVCQVINMARVRDIGVIDAVAHEIARRIRMNLVAIRGQALNSFPIAIAIIHVPTWPLITYCHRPE